MLDYKGPMGTDREKNIHKKMMAHVQYVAKNHPGIYKNCLFIGIQGSQNYDLDIYTDEYKSDLDTKLLYIPTLEEISANTKPLSFTLEMPNTEHIDVKDVRVMFANFQKQNVNFLEILFTDYYFVNPVFENLVEELRFYAERIAHYNTNQAVRCMAGMSMEKLNALEHPYPAKKDLIEKYGYDGKQLHHIIRMNLFAKEYIAGTPFKIALKSHKIAQYEMMKSKLNQYTLEEARALSKKIDEDTKAIKDEYVTEEDEKDTEVEIFLDDLTYRILKKSIIEEIKEM